jgi:hypothetical protein
MRFLILAAVIGAVALPTAASAQYYGGRGGGYGQGYGQGYGYNNRVQRERRECSRELRNARSRWEYQRELRECRREINEARYGYRDNYRDRGDRGYRDGYYRDRRW